jgi:hypothetical protein
MGDQNVTNILLIAFLVVLWWIGVWGFVETLLHQVIKGSASKALLIYSSLIATVLVIVYMKPDLLEHFI